MTARFGITIPFPGVSLADHAPWFQELEELGYTDVWTSESNGADAFTPLALASVSAPTLRLGTAIVPAFTCGPALLAQSAASLADAAPGRFVLGIGSSSPAIVETWNGIPFVDPYRRVADTVQFLRAALAGEAVTMNTSSFAVSGFRLGRVPSETPLIYVAALREGMLRLAARAADGLILNWLSPEDVPQVLDIAKDVPDVVARIFVYPSENTDEVRKLARREITAYLNVPAYAEYQRWLGRGDALTPMWEAWQAGERAKALEAIPDEVVDALMVHGSYAQCRQRIQDYVDNGITTPVLALREVAGTDMREAIRQLAPTA